MTFTSPSYRLRLILGAVRRARMFRYMKRHAEDFGEDSKADGLDYCRHLDAGVPFVVDVKGDHSHHGRRWHDEDGDAVVDTWNTTLVYVFKTAQVKTNTI